MSEISDEDAKAFMADFEELVDGIDAPGIFIHNTIIALPMFVPGAGMVWGFFSAWTTGYAFAAIEATTPGGIGVGIPALALFLLPFGIMEICAYSLALSRSGMMITSIIKREGVIYSAHLKPALIEAGVVVALLLAGAYVELYMIEQVMSI